MQSVLLTPFFCHLLCVGGQLTRVGALALGMDEDTCAHFEVVLSSKIEELLQGLLTSQLPSIKELMKDYLMTSSVLDTFVGPLTELRAVIRFTMSSLKPGGKFGKSTANPGAPGT
jgi:hypothetical protein